MNIKLVFGAMADPVADQLDAQGLWLNVADEDRMQHYADAIVRLSLAGIITQAEMDRARKRLAKEILRCSTRQDGGEHG